MIQLNQLKKGGSMKNEKEAEALKEYFRNRIDSFEECFVEHETFFSISRRQRHDYADKGCDGFCPECALMLKCEAYNEIKEEWKWFYS